MGVNLQFQAQHKSIISCAWLRVESDRKKLEFLFHSTHGSGYMYQIFFEQISART